MGSESDLETLSQAESQLQAFGVSYEIGVYSAHRTPERMFEYAKTAESRGIKVIIAGAGGAAHLPGMVAAITTLPVLGVPVASKHLSGLDSLLSIVQMPGGIPTATFAIGNAGAKNAGLFAVQILALQDAKLAEKLKSFRAAQASAVIESDARLRERTPPPPAVDTSLTPVLPPSETGFQGKS